MDPPSRAPASASSDWVAVAAPLAFLFALGALGGVTSIWRRVSHIGATDAAPLQRAAPGRVPAGRPGNAPSTATDNTPVSHVRSRINALRPWLTALTILVSSLYALDATVWRRQGGMPFRMLAIMLFISLIPVVPYVYWLVYVARRWAHTTVVQPGIQAFGQTGPYLRALVPPVTGFLLGYLCLVVWFATVFKTIYELNNQAFTVSAGGGSLAAFVYFSIGTILPGSADSGVKATSDLTRLLVALETVIGAVWLVVIFAAVIGYVTPTFDTIARAQRRPVARLRRTGRIRAGPRTPRMDERGAGHATTPAAMPAPIPVREKPENPATDGASSTHRS